LAVSVEHGDALRALPPHHRDPFDRMLIAQAGFEGLTIVSRDPAFVPYDVALVWE
jgi:PIN domain nuclease of toxin-antitoxin system